MYHVCKSHMINQSTPVRNQNLVITLLQYFEFSFSLINKMLFQYKLYPTKTLITKMLMYIDCYNLECICVYVCVHMHIYMYRCTCVYILSFVINK